MLKESLENNLVMISKKIEFLGYEVCHPLTLESTAILQSCRY